MTNQLNKKTLYVCVEGIDGVGKTTLIQRLEKSLNESGFSVLCTKEPGSPHLPLTQELRKFTLDKKYESGMTVLAREYIVQATRSIHLEKLIYPALQEKKHDVILQDRGIVSGFAYAQENGVSLEAMMNLSIHTCGQTDMNRMYDLIILLSGDPFECLERARKCKQEFQSGDVMEDRGEKFMQNVFQNMVTVSGTFTEDFVIIDTRNNNETSVFNTCLPLITSKIVKKNGNI